MRKHVFSVENTKLFPGLFPCFTLDTPGFSLLESVHILWAQVWGQHHANQPQPAPMLGYSTMPEK